MCHMKRILSWGTWDPENIDTLPYMLVEPNGNDWRLPAYMQGDDSVCGKNIDVMDNNI